MDDQQLNELIQQQSQRQQTANKLSKIQNDSLRQILYSGNNLSQDQKTLQPNPSLQSRTMYLNGTEQLMQIQERIITEQSTVQSVSQGAPQGVSQGASRSEWQSLTYPDEYVIIQNGVVMQRMNIMNNFITDFDYRNCPIKEVYSDQITLETFQKRYNTFINTVKGRSLTYFLNVSLPDDLYNISQEMYDQLNRLIDTLYERLQILIGYQSDNPQHSDIIIDQNKKQIYQLYDDTFSLSSILQYIQELRHCLELTKLRLGTFFNEDKYYIITDNNPTMVVNILKDAKQNVHIKNSKIYLQYGATPSLGPVDNIQILGSSCLLYGNQNTTIIDSSNIIMKQSTKQGKIYLKNVVNCFTGSGFCKYGGSFSMNNSGASSASSSYFVAHDDTLSSGSLNIQQSSVDMIIKEGSLNKSSVIMSDLHSSKIMIQDNSCNGSEIILKQSLYNSYLNVENMNDGVMTMYYDCFNNYLSNDLNKVCDINGKQYSTIIFPPDIENFFSYNIIKSMEILYGTQNIIYNSVYIKKTKGWVYDNGPLESTSQKRRKKNQYLLVSQPRVIRGEASQWYCYNEQEWGQFE